MNSSVHHSVIIEDLHAGYGSKENYLQVLNAVSFTASPGKLICLMGPNGAGKSTLLRCISGLQAYHSGKVIINGSPLASVSSQTLARTLAVVLTDPVIVPNLTVRELLSMGRYPHLGWMLKFSDEDEEIIENTASDCGITHLLDKHVQSLSDGQRQKVLIGRALAQETDILILDEPTSHLDLNNRVEIINLLRKFTREKNKTIVMATHELDLALQMADRLLLLDTNGKMKQGIPEDLVLNGELDKVFAFKGYDLKTGKVVHPVTGRTVNLQGDGYIYLWTKNALEREGFDISPSAEETIYTNDDGTSYWKMDDKKFQSLEELLELIKKGR